MSKPVVTIFGSGKAKPDDPAWTLAEQTAQILAQAGYAIANGGYGGTMLASARAARQAGAEVIGVTCSAFRNSRPNEYVSREILTESLDQRLDTLIETGAAYVVLPGSTGTLLELAKVWELKNKGFLNAEKPIILLGSYWKPLVELLRTEDPDCDSYVHQVESPEDIVDILNDSV